jgi:hypothetical protein
LILIPLLLTVAGLSLPTLRAQDQAEVSGRVVDQTGAVLPGVSLTLSHETSGHLFRTTSGETGDFVFPFVPPGTYSLTAELPGFAASKLTGIHLTVGQELQLRPELKPGAPATEITVDADPNHIETKTAALRHTTTEAEIEGLPVLLSPHGRQSVNDLILLVPGASDSDPNGIPNLRGWNTTINGSPIGSIGFSLDGADHTALSSDTGGALSPAPNPDALGEFTVKTGLFKAESGTRPVVVHMETKSGGDVFHGQLRAIHMNPSISARPFFASSSYDGGPNQNSFGGQLSGPVILPGLYKRARKTNFFFYLEATRVHDESFGTVAVFSEAERAGDFSSLPENRWPVDPLTRSPFPGGRIPETRILPESRFYVDNLIPHPVQGKLWEGLVPTSHRGWQLTASIDHQFSPDDTLNVSIFNFDAMIWITRPATLETIESISQKSPGIAIRHTHSFSPRAANSFVFGRSKYRYGDAASGRLKEVDPREYGFNISLGEKDGKGLPRVLIYSTNSFDPGGWQQSDNDTVWSWSDDLSYAKGLHTLQWGAGMRWVRAGSPISPTPLYQFAAFNPVGTRNDVADFLLGIPVSYAQAAAIENYPRRVLSALYLQDDLKIRTNLSLNLGIRYEANGVWTSADGRNAVFRPGAQSQVFTNAPVGVLFPGDQDPWSRQPIGEAMTPPDHDNLAPRIGLAYSPEMGGGFWGNFFGGPGRTAFRLGYGVYYICSRADAVTHGASLPPWFFAARRDAQTIAAAGGNFVDPWGSDGNPFPVPLDARAFSSPVAGLMSVDLAMADPYQHQWLFSIQRQLSRDLALELAYVGNTALHLHRKLEANPGLLTPDASVSNLESRRQYPAFGSVRGYVSDGVSTYHGLQVLLNRRFTSGLLFNAHYTWSKALDNSGGNIAGGIFGFGDQDSTTWARSNSDRNHQFVFLGTWELPRFQRGGLLRHLFSGWRASGDFQLRSGLPLDIRNSVDSTLIGAEPGTPDIIGPFRRLDPREVQTFTMPNGRQQTGNFVFDPTVFQPLYPDNPEEARAGNLGRNSFTGPGMNQVNLSLMKRFDFAERRRIEVRADFLNLFNHTQFIVMNRNSFVADYATFGMASSLPPRRIQFMLKYNF